MRIRGRKLNPASSSSSPDHSVSSSSSSCSSITATHSSLISSQDSSHCSAFSSIGKTIHRCHGLDLLVKAIHQVSDGSVIGFPYIQRRVTTRRRPRIRAIEFDALIFAQKKLNSNNNKKNKKNTKKKGKNTATNRKLTGLRSQIRDPVLQPWGRRSGEIDI